MKKPLKTYMPSNVSPPFGFGCETVVVVFAIREYRMLRGLYLPIKLIVSVSLLVALLGGCWGTVQKFDPLSAGKYEGFIHDGKTTKKEVMARLGYAHSTYENGKILIYNVYLKDGKMSLQGNYKCNALVLLFDEDNVLERHSLIKYGCKEKTL